jgi:hypothetical protein
VSERSFSEEERFVIAQFFVGRTGKGIDRVRNVMVLRLARTPEDREWVERLVLDSSRAWLNQLTLWQRKWQLQTRRPARARHHDSIQIREKYVRCTA